MGKKISGKKMSLVPGKKKKTKEGEREERWLIPASDLKGKGVRANFRLPPHLAEWTNRVENSRDLPFYKRGNGFIYRKGLEMVLKHCQELDGSFKTEEMIFNTCTDILRNQERLVEHREMLAYSENVVDRLVKAGMKGEAKRVVKGLRVEYEKMEDDAWKRNLLKAFDKRMRVHLEDEED